MIHGSQDKHMIMKLKIILYEYDAKDNTIDES